MKKIQYYELQEKYPQKVVILNKNKTRVLAAGNGFASLLKQIAKQKIPLSEVVFMGPIQKAGAVNVFFSLSEKNNRRG